MRLRSATVLGVDPIDPRVYVRVAAQLRDRITSGQLTRGDAMPSTRHIAAEYGCSIETAQKSLKILAGEGLIRKFPGKSYYVV